MAVGANVDKWVCSRDGAFCIFGGVSGRTREQARRLLRERHHAEEGHHLELIDQVFRDQQKRAQEKGTFYQTAELGRYGRPT